MEKECRTGARVHSVLVMTAQDRQAADDLARDSLGEPARSASSGSGRRRA